MRPACAARVGRMRRQVQSRPWARLGTSLRVLLCEVHMYPQIGPLAALPERHQQIRAQSGLYRACACRTHFLTGHWPSSMGNRGFLSRETASRLRATGLFRVLAMAAAPHVGWSLSLAQDRVHCCPGTSATPLPMRHGHLCLCEHPAKQQATG